LREQGEVSASHADGGVKSHTGAFDPSVGLKADTSPASPGRKFQMQIALSGGKPLKATDE
jgi:hypothetical protein